MSARQESSLLIVEDHPDISDMLTSYFESRGFAVDYAADGLTGLHLAVTNRYDAIVLDLMLPGLDGLSICEKLRHDARNSTPIIMLTARDTLDDKVTGLSTGADDYLVKPFAIAELEARIVAQIRRNRGELTRDLLTVGDLVIDTSTMMVRRQGAPLRGSSQLTRSLNPIDQAPGAYYWGPASQSTEIDKQAGDGWPAGLPGVDYWGPVGDSVEGASNSGQ